MIELEVFAHNTWVLCSAMGGIIVFYFLLLILIGAVCKVFGIKAG